MKKVLAFLALLPLLWSAQAAAIPCVAGTLTSYQSLGATGCTIGSATFSNFGLLLEPTGATPFTTITITPVGSGSAVGLDFVVAPNAAVHPTLFENLIAYRVTGLSATVIGASAAFTSGFLAVAGDGGITVTENYCEGGTFTGSSGLDGCTGTADSLILFDTLGGSSTSDSLAAFAAGSVAVVSDIAIDGGTSGSATLGAPVGNRFALRSRVAAVPEPDALLLLAGGVLAAALSRRALRRRRS